MALFPGFEEFASGLEALLVAPVCIRFELLASWNPDRVGLESFAAEVMVAAAVYLHRLFDGIHLGIAIRAIQTV